MNFDRGIRRGAQGGALHLSATSPEGLAMSIITGREGPYGRSGVSAKKIAQRIILELKDKLAKGQLGTSAGGEQYGGPGSRSFRKINLLRPPPPWLCWATVRLKLPSP